LRLHGHDLRFLSAKSRAVFRCIACAAALTPPPTPPSQGGENLRRLVFFPPLRRGETGGCFECLCAVPGSSSTRLKIALDDPTLWLTTILVRHCPSGKKNFSDPTGLQVLKKCRVSGR